MNCDTMDSPITFQDVKAAIVAVNTAKSVCVDALLQCRFVHIIGVKDLPYEDKLSEVRDCVRVCLRNTTTECNTLIDNYNKQPCTTVEIAKIPDYEFTFADVSAEEKLDACKSLRALHIDAGRALMGQRLDAGMIMIEYAQTPIEMDVCQQRLPCNDMTDLVFGIAEQGRIFEEINCKYKNMLFVENRLHLEIRNLQAELDQGADHKFTCCVCGCDDADTFWRTPACCTELCHMCYINNVAVDPIVPFECKNCIGCHEPYDFESVSVPSKKPRN